MRPSGLGKSISLSFFISDFNICVGASMINVPCFLSQVIVLWPCCFLMIMCASNVRASEGRRCWR